MEKTEIEKRKPHSLTVLAHSHPQGTVGTVPFGTLFFHPLLILEEFQI